MAIDSKPKSRKKKKVLLVYLTFSSFVKRDYDILSKHYTVRKFQWNGKRSIPMLLKELLWADMVFSWFISGNSYVSTRIGKLLGKKIVLVAGGFDVAYEPEIGYGATIDPRNKKHVKYSLNNADIVLAVSEKSKKECLAISSSTNVRVVYNGVDSSEYHKPTKKDRIAITVGNVTSDTMVKKGILTFIKSAMYLPDIQFYVVGKMNNDCKDQIDAHLSDNVHMLGWVDAVDLSELYQRTKVYVQPSIHESFGVSVLESMLCECVPVVTELGALPEVVGDTGYYAQPNDPKDTARAISLALEDTEKGKLARERGISKFDIQEREKGILNAMVDLTSV